MHILAIKRQANTAPPPRRSRKLKITQIPGYLSGLINQSSGSAKRTPAVSPGIRLRGSSRRTVRQADHVDALFAVRARYFSSGGRRCITNYDPWRDKRAAEHASTAAKLCLTPLLPRESLLRNRISASTGSRGQQEPAAR